MSRHTDDSAGNETFWAIVVFAAIVVVALAISRSASGMQVELGK